LNEDLIEAIGLGHDLGHTPFGHEGEKVMDEWCGERGMKDGFQHHIQSVRVVEVLEREGQGLNLTHEVVEGILKHTKGKSDYTLDVGSVESLHWEGRVVKISDRIAYVNHDLQDAIYSGLISDSDIPSKFIDFLGTRNSLRIGSMVNNIIFTTLENGVLSMTPEMQEMVNELKDWMFDRVYFHPVVRQHDMVIKRCMVGILNTFYEDEEVSKEYMRGWEEDEGKRLRKIVDYVAGMTDRYAVKVAQELMLPSPWPL
jgi:dGTPase